jgi:hypothetical protein
MKTHGALVIGLALTAAIAVHAQDFADLSKDGNSHSREYSPKVLNFQRVEKNYLSTLSSDVPGVVESALGHVTLMRIVYPKQDLGKIQEKLYDLASQGATQSIRHKAFTAMQVFANPAAFKDEIVSGQTCGDGLLERIAGKL